MEVSVPFNHITLGNVLEMVTMIAIGLGFIFGMRGALSSLGQRMNAVEKEVGKLVDVLITLGRYEERFLRNENDIWDLKHGKGFVTEIPQRPRERTGAVRTSDRWEPPSGDPEVT